MVRVMDEKPDAKTLFYAGGDERNVVKDRPPVPPGVPAALGGKFAVEPVSLPPTSWYPGLKAFVRREETAKREEAVKAARAEFDQAKDAAAVRLAGARLTAATSDLIALKVRIAADDVVYRGAKGDPTAASESASKLERQHALDTAVLGVVQAEAGVVAAQAAGKADSITAAEKQLTAAKAKADAARKALEASSVAYTPLSPIYPWTS